MTFDFERMPRDALIRELRKLREVDVRMNALGDSDPAVLLRELHLHQVELETQNRELLEAQLALEESRARYADLYNSAPVGIVSFDAVGVITEMNLTAASLLGLPRSQLLGISFAQLVIPGDRRSFWTHLRRCLSERCRVSTEITLMVQDRKVHLQLIGANAAEPGGTTCRTSLFDITELKQSEARLRLLSDASQSLACSLDYGSTLGVVAGLAVPLFADACLLHVVGENGKVQRVEAVAADPTMQRELERRMYGASAPSEQHHLQRAVIESGRSALFEQRPPTSREREEETAALWDTLCAQTMIVVPVSARGHTLGALTFVTAGSLRRYGPADVAFADELARRAAMAIDNALLYDQAQCAVQARENLLAIVSHDLQNPLSVILMRAAALLPLADDPLADDLAAIERAARGMRGLIHDLLDLASLDAGVFSLSVGTLLLGPLIDDVVDALSPLAAQRGIALVQRGTDVALEVRCDRDRIQQVLTNLLDNALKFTPTGGTISVTASRVDAEAHVAIADTGCGITSEQLPHIFDRYWRGRREQRTGTGLGLSICKAIIEAHHTRIWADSTPGQGATFYFALPLVIRTSSPTC